MKALPKSKAKTAYGLLSEIAKLIVDEPKRYNQMDYISTTEGRNITEYAPQGFPTCGTVGCVAGWVATLKGKAGRQTPYADVGDVASEILGLDDTQASYLFYSFAVPGDPQTPAHAKFGAAHIRDFQQRNAAQLKAKAV